MNDKGELPEEYKLLLRELRQAARTLLDVGAKMPYALGMFRLQLQLEALARTKDKRLHAAKLLGVHRNTFTRNLDPSLRKCAERYDRRPPSRAARASRQIKITDIAG